MLQISNLSIPFVRMDNYQVYLAQLNQLALQVYHNQLFEELTIVLTICVFFLLGRLSYEKRLTHLLEIVNDAEATRKKLTIKLESQNNLLRKIESKRKIIWVLLGISIISNAVIYYLTREINTLYILYTTLPFLAIGLVYFSGRRWSQWKRNNTEKRLKNTSHTAETQMKQISKIFGVGLKERLKKLYETEIEALWSKQSKEQCKLYKCYNEKKSYEELYKLYEEIIDQMKKTNMCDVCLSENNIPVQKLGLQELQHSIKSFKKARTGKVPLVQKKQMVNKLLFEYQKVMQKLPHICKKGCCIKQRVVIENVKAKYHERLRRATSQLLAVQKKG